MAGAPTIAPVRLGLLGPLQLHVDGREVRVNGHRRRAILSILGAAAGRVVTTDVLLADAFFDVGSPQPNTLHVHVSQLRALLAPHGAGVRRQATGYLLDDRLVRTDAGTLDRAVAVAGRARSPAAVDDLRTALQAWRGDFCEDVPLPVLEGRRVYYRELRLSASELLFDAELQQGGSPDLPERIETLLAIDPLRERLWGHLMLALFASGRQSEALAAYRRARTVLAEVAGLDPGPALRELEALVLRQADSIDAVSPVLPASSAPTLVWLDADGVLKARPVLGDRPVVIGRAADSDIRIDWDPLVSRRHAGVTRTAEGFVVTDLGSTNGCSVDGRPVEDTALLDIRGTLQVGDTVLFLRGPTHRVDPHQPTKTARHEGDAR